MVAVDRSSPRRTLVDLDVGSSLRGDSAAAHTAGDDTHVLATDGHENTVSPSARDGVGSPEAFALRLARHFAGAHDRITGTRVAVHSFGWDRTAVGGQPNEHASAATAARCGRRLLHRGPALRAGGGHRALRRRPAAGGLTGTPGFC